MEPITIVLFIVCTEIHLFIHRKDFYYTIISKTLLSLTNRLKKDIVELIFSSFFYFYLIKRF